MPLEEPMTTIAPPPRGAHEPRRAARGEEDAADVDRHVLVEDRGRQVEDAVVLVGLDAGVADADVEAAVCRFDLGEQAVDVVLAAHVAAHPVRRRPRAPRAVAERPSSRSPSRPQIVTAAPSPASRRAVASPIPLLPPVTSATLSRNLIGRLPSSPSPRLDRRRAVPAAEGAPRVGADPDADAADLVVLGEAQLVGVAGGAVVEDATRQAGAPGHVAPRAGRAGVDAGPAGPAASGRDRRAGRKREDR